MANIDRTAIMTSNTTPAPNVTSASSELGVGNEAFKAFDKADTQWITNSTTTGWIKYDFGSPNWIITGYSIEPQSTTRICKNWTLQTSLDDVSYTTVDTQTNQTTWTTGVKVNYTTSINKTARYVKLDVTANNGDATYLEIDEIQIFGIKSGILGGEI